MQIYYLLIINLWLFTFNTHKAINNIAIIQNYFIIFKFCWLSTFYKHIFRIYLKFDVIFIAFISPNLFPYSESTIKKIITALSRKRKYVIFMLPCWYFYTQKKHSGNVTKMFQILFLRDIKVIQHNDFFLSRSVLLCTRHH